ncbi:MAG: M23 family metallopeptidase [Solirubrobacteraceae bacterium]|nr:M23 family metallopeptidase [Solirubrobacteraceae bacterium]
MPVSTPPPPWIPPVSPVLVERRYREVAPYAAGGHRGIDLATRVGDRVGSPCGGRVVFRGRVAGGPQVVTVDCGDLRATLGRVAPASAIWRGASVRRGATVGVATAAAIDLSARHPDGSYLDPLPLLAEAGRHRLPPVVGAPKRRPARPGREASRPAHLPEGALLLPAGIGAPARFGDARPGRRDLAGRVEVPQLRPGSPATADPVDWPLAAGAGLAVLAASLTGLRVARGRPRSGRASRRLPILALVARDRR